MDNSQLAITYAALLLADDDVAVTAEKIITVTKAAGIEVEPVMAQLYTKALSGVDLKEFITNIAAGGDGPVPSGAGAPEAPSAAAAAPAAEEKKKKEEPKEESDDDMGFGLFD